MLNGKESLEGELVDKSYEERYSEDDIFGIYTYASISVSRGFLVSELVSTGGLFTKRLFNPKVLVVGAGSGYEIINYLNHGYDVKAIDLYVPDVKRVKEVTHVGSADNMPFDDKEFDFVHCTEMMEHVPEEITDDILLECKRVSKRFIFTIATRHDKPYNSHINIHPAWWWMKKFEDLGLETEHAQKAARVLLVVNGYSSYMCWPDGVLMYGNC